MSEASARTEAHVESRNPYGVVAEFRTPEAVLDAAERARKAGYRHMDAYTPYAVEGLDEALGFRPTRLGWVVLAMGIFGLVAGFYMQWFANVEWYPLNIGGRPLNSWPNFIVITFEVTVLLSSFTAGLVMIARNGLPRLHHPIFDTPNFEAATRDRFFLCIEARDPRFDLRETRAFLQGLEPERVSEVES